MTPGHPLKVAAAGDCPRCEARTLFNGWVQFAPKCRSCGLDFAAFNVGDGPAAFLILIVGAIVVAAALFVDAAFEPPWWVHIVWIPVATALTSWKPSGARSAVRRSPRTYSMPAASG